MKIRIRVYNPYDLDLLALMQANNFSIANAMKQTLIYYAAGKRYLVEVPTLNDSLIDDKYSRGFYVELDDQTDAQAIEFIKRVPDGSRNAFMKNILRASLEVSPISLYLQDGGAAHVAKMIANPRYGKHPVQKEIIDPVFLAEGEIGVSLSDEQPDISKLPHGTKAAPKPKKKKQTPQEELRESTKAAYDLANNKKREKEREREEVLSKIQHQEKASESGQEEIEDLLNSIMG